MPWAAPDLRRIKGLADLRTALVKSLPDLFQRARCYERVARLPYGTTVRPSGDTSQTQLVEVTDSVAFTVANPSRPRDGVELTLAFHLNAPGAMGDVTFGSEYRLDGAFVKPGPAQHAIYTFAWVPE